MKNEEATVYKNDCDFADISVVKDSLSIGNILWKLCNSVRLPLEEVVFIAQVCFIFIVLKQKKFI